MKVRSETEVAQSCQTLRDPMDCSKANNLKKKKESEDHNNEKTSTGNSNKMIQDILTPGSTQCY